MTLKSLAKRALFAVAPEFATSVSSRRARAHSHRLVRAWGLFEINRRLIEELGSTVQAGPFAGLQLPASIHDEHLGPFVLGTYEMELHPWWTEILKRRYAMIVDVGAKFGYYAVGLAAHFRGVPVVAFDTDPWARSVLADTANANGVGNVEIRGYCRPGWFSSNLKPNSLVVSDCEGFEAALFTVNDAAAFDSATLIIELHESMAPGVSAAIAARFSRTHRLRTVQSREASPVTTTVRTLSAEELRRAASEVRSPQEWLLAEPTGAGCA